MVHSVVQVSLRDVSMMSSDEAKDAEILVTDALTDRVADVQISPQA